MSIGVYCCGWEKLTWALIRMLMMQSVLHLLERLRLLPTGGRDTEFPCDYIFGCTDLPLNACRHRCWPGAACIFLATSFLAGKASFTASRNMHFCASRVVGDETSLRNHSVLC